MKWFNYLNPFALRHRIRDLEEELDARRLHCQLHHVDEAHYLRLVVQANLAQKVLTDHVDWCEKHHVAKKSEALN